MVNDGRIVITFTPGSYVFLFTKKTPLGPKKPAQGLGFAGNCRCPGNCRFAANCRSAGNCRFAANCRLRRLASFSGFGDCPPFPASAAAPFCAAPDPTFPSGISSRVGPLFPASAISPLFRLRRLAPLFRLRRPALPIAGLLAIAGPLAIAGLLVIAGLPVPAEIEKGVPRYFGRKSLNP